MISRLSRPVLLCATLALYSLAYGQPSQSSIDFKVSMERPADHYFHVVMRVQGLQGDSQDFKMPVWTPGFYEILNFAQYVDHFQAEAGGKPLEWEKTTKNTWHVHTGNVPSITVSYDVYAFNNFVANSYLDENKAYISPAGVFMHVAGQIQHPVTVTIEPSPGFKIATGLEPVPDKKNTFSATDFDVLYDCPILMGNLESLRFEAGGIPYDFEGMNLGKFDRQVFVSDLKRIVEAGTSIIGDVPYSHYTFLDTGPGRGGIEHLNSQSIGFMGTELDSPAATRRFLSFVAHEFFHLYNVKRIRPIELGPFDYDRENLTHLLWVSEGFTVYYENMLLRRAGFVSRDELLDIFSENIASYENKPGHLVQSATESSFETWTQPFTRSGHADDTTVSYYDKGSALGLLLDFKIRHETHNQKSLDDVMRSLYHEYYQEKKRGFTDAEFRATCEAVAGCPLPELFDYATTAKPVDYAAYLACAGLQIDLPKATDEPYLGVTAQEQDGKVTISKIESDSPAGTAGLQSKDELVGVDGQRVSDKNLDSMVRGKKRGDRVKLLYARNGELHEVSVTLAGKMDKGFHIHPLPHPDSLQSEILKSWSSVNGSD